MSRKYRNSTVRMVIALFTSVFTAMILVRLYLQNHIAKEVLIYLPSLSRANGFATDPVSFALLP